MSKQAELTYESDPHVYLLVNFLIVPFYLSLGPLLILFGTWMRQNPKPNDPDPGADAIFAICVILAGILLTAVEIAWFLVRQIKVWNSLRRSNSGLNRRLIRAFVRSRLGGLGCVLFGAALITVAYFGLAPSRMEFNEGLAPATTPLDSITKNIGPFDAARQLSDPRLGVGMFIVLGLGSLFAGFGVRSAARRFSEGEIRAICEAHEVEERSRTEQRGTNR